VVIPVYNGVSVLRRTLQTVRGQKDHDVEIVVVDDGSTEDIGTLAREMGVVYRRLPTNSGPATARTEGAKAATGEVILFTDSDVWLPENLLAKVRTVFAERECECVQGTFSARCPFSNFFSQYKNLYNRYVLSLLGPWVNTTYTSITAVRKDFFLGCGGFDLNIRTASVEDRTLGESIVRGGGRIYLDHSLEVIHNKKLTAAAFYRSQFRRSRDLAKLLMRQRESEFLQKEESFGTTSKQAMLRLPLAVLSLLCAIASIGTLWLLIPTVLAILAHALMYRGWISYLLRTKGLWFAVRGQVVDFTDALVSAAGVAVGFFEYRFRKKRY